MGFFSVKINSNVIIMAMDFNKRHYLDYNSTSPLSENVKNSIINDLYPFQNASSQHLGGKKALKHIKEVTNYLFNFFGLDSELYNLYYHSGATEGINTILNQKEGNVFFFGVDHPCVSEMEENSNFKKLKISNEGKIDFEQTFEFLKNNSLNDDWINYTYINNETGIVWPLDIALKFKEKFGLKVHVDAVQLVGKLRSFKLLNEIDAYTFSGHKFGALKGIGFSFIKKDIILKPLTVGGDQQKGFKSGTLNTHGILSLKDALEDFIDFESKADELSLLKNELICIIETNPNLEYISNESLNTVSFLHKSSRSDTVFIHFDLAGLEVSTGSACSSGSIRPSRVISEMGRKDLASNLIRISLGLKNLQDKEAIIENFKKVIQKI